MKTADCSRFRRFGGVLSGRRRTASRLAAIRRGVRTAYQVYDDCVIVWRNAGRQITGHDLAGQIDVPVLLAWERAKPRPDAPGEPGRKLAAGNLSAVNELLAHTKL